MGWCALWIYCAASGGAMIGFLLAALLHAGHEENGNAVD